MRKTLKSNNSPKSRTELGNAVLASARVIDVTAIAPRLAEFEKAHARFLAADARVAEVEARVQGQTQRVGEADAAQDAAVLRLANALVGDGLPRANPFKPLGFPSPSALAKLGYANEAGEAQRLAQAVLGRPEASSATQAAAKALQVAAGAVETALLPMEKLVEVRTAALRERDTVGQTWEARLAALKLAAKVADADGAGSVYAALFTGATPARRKPRKKSSAAS